MKKCSLSVVSQNVSLAVVGMGEKLLIIDDDKVQPYVSFTLLFHNYMHVVKLYSQVKLYLYVTAV